MTPWPREQTDRRGERASDPAPDDHRQHYPVAEVQAMYPLVRDEHLRELERHALLRVGAGDDGQRVMSFKDLLVVRHVHADLKRGATFRAVVRSLAATRFGQLALDFRTEPQPAKVITLQQPPAVVQARARAAGGDYPAGVTQPAEASLAEQYFLLASTLDDGTVENRARAADAYRQALEVEPRLVPATINLANIHYANDHLIEAQALYERAIALDPDVFEGFFNLGNIHHDLGRYAEAEGFYRRALEISPGYPEAHLYLAVALEKADRPGDARPHWQAYRNLAPNGEWVDLAREFGDN
ncbi:MAG: tetratricopeptide repeat protein [Acidobacteriota bacterium]